VAPERPGCLIERTGFVREGRHRLSVHVEGLEVGELVNPHEAKGAVRIVHGKAALGGDGHTRGLFRRLTCLIY
jgi:hypothetical protein